MIDYDLSHVPSEWLDVTLTPGPGSPIHQPVLALTITNGNRVLVCVRSARRYVTHPNVLSSPTLRIRGDGGLADIITLAVTKLEVPRDEAYMRLQVERVRSWHGHSLIGTERGRPVTYPLTMVNAHIETDYTFPVTTAHYSWIGWVDRDLYCKAVEERDVSLLGVTFEHPPVMYGLCTQSTCRMLKALEDAK